MAAAVIPPSWQVPEAISSRFGAQAGRQRAMFHEGHLLLVTHRLPVPGHVERDAALFWRAPDGNWKATGADRGGLAGLRDLVGDYHKAVSEWEDRGENAQRANEYFEVIHAISPIMRAARNLHKTLQAAREAVPGDKDLISIRDLAYEIERTAEITYNDARAGLEFAQAKRAEEQAELQHHIARSSHKLNLLAALFFPVTAIATIFGVNFTHGFEQAYAPVLFWIVVAAAFAVGFAVRASVGRKDG